MTDEEIRMSDEEIRISSEITLHELKVLEDNIHDSHTTFVIMKELCYKYFHSKQTIINVFFIFMKEYSPNKIITKSDLNVLSKIYSYAMKFTVNQKKYIYSLQVEAWLLHTQWINKKIEQTCIVEGKEDNSITKSKRVKFDPSITYFFY